MRPQINVFGKDISLYALFSVIGILLSLFLVWFIFRKIGQPDSEAFFLVLIAAGGAFLGSHVLFAITRIRDIPQIFQTKPVHLALLELFGGGGVFYGGLLGGILAGFIYIKCKKMNLVFYSDVAAVCLPLFHSFARVGCFFAGCCYGIESPFGFASAENRFIPDVVGVTRFPVQLVEAVCEFALFIVLIALFIRAIKSGKGRRSLLAVYLLSYSVIRFTLEFFRGDTIRGIWWGMSTSQWISIIIFVTVVIMFILKRIKVKEHSEN